jgi:mitochondrial fission protein ELM1
MGPGDMRVLARQLKEAAASLGGGLVITPSRRTGDDALGVLREELKGTPHFLWDGRGGNPYFGILGIADFLVVTCDSVNMVSEACATGKPVYVAELPGGSEKFRRFHDALRDDGVTRSFAGQLQLYTYKPMDDMGEAARAVEAGLARHRGGVWK